MTPSRRFRYSLRTLFVVVTLLCVWLGYSLNWIRQRREFIAEQQARDAVITKWGGEIASPHPPGQAAPRAPAGLWLFGESGYFAVAVVVDGDDGKTSLSAVD